MTIYLLSKAFPFLIRLEYMKAASIECKPKWRSFHVACKDITHQKSTVGIGV
jgi:hypothetical protein